MSAAIPKIALGAWSWGAGAAGGENVCKRPYTSGVGKGDAGRDSKGSDRWISGRGGIKCRTCCVCKCAFSGSRPDWYGTE